MNDEFGHRSGLFMIGGALVLFVALYLASMGLSAIAEPMVSVASAP
jgi:hypothetical protein